MCEGRGGMFHANTNLIIRYLIIHYLIIHWPGRDPRPLMHCIADSTLTHPDALLTHRSTWRSSPVRSSTTASPGEGTSRGQLASIAERRKAGRGSRSRGQHRWACREAASRGASRASVMLPTFLRIWGERGAYESVMSRK